MRLLVAHYSGDFREAWRRLQSDGDEVYYGHRYILEELARLAARHGEAGYLSCLAPAYREALPGRVTVMGAGVARPGLRPGAVIRLMADYDPTHLVVHGPMRTLIHWGLSTRRQVACVFADSFALHPLLFRLRFGWMKRMLNDPGVSLVANHGVNAARDLARIGVRPDKILPWDFPHLRRPDERPAKTGPGAAPHSILYVGLLMEKKGLGDLIDAIALLRRRGRIVRLRIAGAGRRDLFERQVSRLGVGDAVEFLGLVPNAQVPALMHAADTVVVPSRHAFPEGLPLTLYEALSSRTPLVASDHPMFAGHLVDGRSALVFPAGRAEALADQVARLLDDPLLYRRLSEAAPRTWAAMQLPVKWGEMLDRWMSGGAADRAWLASHSLASGLYGKPD